jgi:cystathionine gamma-lyase/cystathionine beta-lyase/cystathionine gamma-lyase/homocysteine desulfhydrase
MRKPVKKKVGKPRRKPSLATQVIHAGQAPDAATGAIMPPIYATSTYVHPALDRLTKYDYARTINPTRSALERNLVALEGGQSAYTYASGMAAISAIMTLLRTGDHVVVSHNVYGGTYRLFEQVLRDYGLDFSWVDTSDLAALRKAIRTSTRMLFIETPTNPILTLTDIRAVSKIARKHGLILVVDNTFMTPVFQRPLELGADIVVHSTTKYLNGHSDSLGGAVIVRDEAHGERLGFVQKSVGAVLSPFESWLVLRGIKTLALRMERHDKTGRTLAKYLSRRPKVRRVVYPGLPSHPQRALARRQMTGFGGMISFDVGSYERARRFLGKLKICALAESLGGVETLISHPASMTHVSVPEPDRKRLGITPGLVRLSVGIEDPEDLIADLAAGFAAI